MEPRNLEDVVFFITDFYRAAPNSITTFARACVRVYMQKAHVQVLCMQTHAHRHVYSKIHCKDIFLLFVSRLNSMKNT